MTHWSEITHWIFAGIGIGIGILIVLAVVAALIALLAIVGDGLKEHRIEKRRLEFGLPSSNTRATRPDFVAGEPGADD